MSLVCTFGESLFIVYYWLDCGFMESRGSGVSALVLFVVSFVTLLVVSFVEFPPEVTV